MRAVYISAALFIVLLFAVLPTPGGLSREAFIMFGILSMAVILWLTEAIPLAATGLLIIALQPLLGIADAKEVFSNFGNRAVFFILASFMIAAAIEKYELHKRIAVKMLKAFGKSPSLFIFGIMLVGALLSFLIQEHIVAAILLPILLHVLISLKVLPKQSNFGITTMIALTFGTSIGSWGTLLGGARNPLTVGFLEEIQNGYSISFLEWMKMSMPIVFIALPIVTLILLRLYPPEIKDIRKAVVKIEEDANKMGKLKKEEKAVLLIYIATIVMWILFSDKIGVAVIALMTVSLLFFLKLVDWEDVERRVQWGIILLYGGAITMGKSLESTGAIEWLAGKITPFFGGSEIALLAFLIFLTFILTNFMSNTAAVATMLPISIGIAQQAGISPVLSAMAVAIAGGGAFMFVIATPGAAIAYSSGYITQKQLAKAGLIAGILCMLIILGVAIFYWKFLLGL
ncbi:MAG: DASS family sodium-coupled anion symporter [Thermoplasmata archaeon]|nr:MAG: DASS family sodium-coupled anion symporter [Thermoplasmata archaeon]